MERLRLLPFLTNSGSTSCDGRNEVSRTRFRSALVRRSRRGLYVGKDGIGLSSDMRSSQDELIWLFRLRRDHVSGAGKLDQKTASPARSQVAG